MENKAPNYRSILHAFLSVVILSCLIAVVFVGVMLLLKTFLLGFVSPSMVPWVYFAAYLVSFLLVGGLYVLYTRRKTRRSSQDKKKSR